MKIFFLKPLTANNSIQTELLTKYLELTEDNSDNETVYTIAQKTAALAVILQNTDSVTDPSLINNIASNLVATVENYGNLLVGGPVVVCSGLLGAISN